MMRRPPPSGADWRPPVLDSARGFPNDASAKGGVSVAKKRGQPVPTRKAADTETVPGSATEDEIEAGLRDLDGSVTEDDSQYMPPPPQPRRNTASRPAGPELHAVKHERLPPQLKRNTASRPAGSGLHADEHERPPPQLKRNTAGRPAGSELHADEHERPPSQPKQNTASRPAGSELHADGHEKPPKKKAKQAVEVKSRVDSMESGTGNQIESGRQRGGAPDKDRRKVGIVDERLGSKQGVGKATIPNEASHQTAAVSSDKIKAAKAAAARFVVTPLGRQT